MALVAALWLVVAIAAVTLQFSMEAHERRAVGLLASERGIQRAAALGALALTQAKLEYALRVAPTGTNVQRLASSDPWLDVDSLYSAPVEVDSMEVDVRARDLGEKLNINRLTENELQAFFSFVLGDYAKSTQLAQSILDWRDADSIPRPNGAERDAYIKAKMLALPTNGPFREIEELSNVMGMTPEIYAKVAPYLTTHGIGAVNINTAPIPVLRALPGMTDATINMVVQQRSQGRRINSLSDIAPSGRTLAGMLSTVQLQTAIGGRLVYQTTEVELTITSRAGPQAPPSRLTAILRRDNPVTVTFKEW